MLYLWRSSEENVTVDLHLVVLADKDGAHIVFVVQLRREGYSRPAPRRPCVWGCVSNLGEYWTAAKPPSGRVAHHSVGFFKLRQVLDCS